MTPVFSLGLHTHFFLCFGLHIHAFSRFTHPFSSVYEHPRIYIPFSFSPIFLGILIPWDYGTSCTISIFPALTISVISVFVPTWYLSLPFPAFVIHIRSIRQAHNFYIMPFRSITFVITLQPYNYINVLFFFHYHGCGPMSTWEFFGHWSVLFSLPNLN